MKGKIRKLLGMQEEVEEKEEGVNIPIISEVDIGPSSETIFDKLRRINNQPEIFYKLSSAALREDLDKLADFQNQLFAMVDELSKNIDVMARFVDNLFEALRSNLPESVGK